MFDQIWRGNIAPGMRVLDAGCGQGRNLVYLLREGYEVFGVDANGDAIADLRAMARELAPGLPGENFRIGTIEKMPVPEGFADVVICNSVLHFAWDEEHFAGMVRGLWRAVRPGGMLFCRLGSTIGGRFTAVRGNIYEMGDGQEWYLVDEAMLMVWTRELGGELVDPLKTTVVQGSRCMTTWVVRKGLG